MEPNHSDLAGFTAAAAVNLAGVLLEMNMPTLVEELSERARALSPEDRALLAEHLLESLPDESESEVEELRRPGIKRSPDE